VDLLIVDPHWTALEAVGAIGLFPRLPVPVVRMLVAPYRALHRVWWWLGTRLGAVPGSATDRIVRNAGDLEFVARKPESAPGGG
jgi:hypothetical protein